MIQASKIIVLKELDTPEALITLRSDGIIFVHYKADVTVDIELQLSMRELYKQLAPGKKLHYIFSASSGVTFTKEARENSIKGDSPIGSYAVIVTSLAQRIVANFYLKFNKPKIPYRVFLSVEEAIDWLHKNESKL